MQAAADRLGDTPELLSLKKSGSPGERKSLRGRGGGKTLGINQSPAMGSLTDFDALIVHGRYCKTQLVVRDFQKLRGHRYALADFGWGHMSHVHVNPHRLLVFIQVRRYQENASVFHESNHCRRREHIRDKLLCPHLECRQIGLRVCKSGNEAVFHTTCISQESRELIPICIPRAERNSK